MKATRCWIPILVAMVFLGLGTAYAANGFIKTLPEFEEGEVETQGKIDNADAAGIQDGTQINYEEDVANTPPPPPDGPIGVGEFVSFTVVGNLATNIQLATPTSGDDVDIDIKPGNDRNSINLKSKGVIPVAILGSSDFDVSDVKVSSLRFGPDEAEPVHDGHIEDVNGDGVPDLVAHFRTQDTGLSNGDTQATLIGETNGGTALEGSDAVRIPKGRRLSKPVGAVSPSISAGRLTDFLDGDFSAFDSPAVRHVLSMSGNLEFGLYQNYPNPFNPSTTIRYTIVEASDVRLMIYNVLGQPIRVLVNATQGPGAYSVQWDGRDKVGRQLSTGIYLYRLVAGQNVAVRKMVFTK